MHKSDMYMFLNPVHVKIELKINGIYEGVEAETRKSQASFQII